MKSQLSLLLITLFFTLIDCRSMKSNIGKMRFKPCSTAGAGAVKWVKITPCDTDPCVFRPMTDVTITVSAIAPRDIQSAKLQAYLEGMNTPFPGFTMELCDQAHCPIRKGTPFILTHTVRVPVVPTKVSSNVNFVTTMNGGAEVLSCVQVNVILDDGRQHVLPPISAKEALEQFQAAKSVVDPFGFSDMIMAQTQG